MLGIGQHIFQQLILLILIIAWSASQPGGQSDNLPRIRSKNGELVLEAGGAGSIFFNATSVKVGEEDLFATIQAAKQVQSLSERLDRVVAQLGINNDSSANGLSSPNILDVMNSSSTTEIARKLRNILKKLREMEKKQMEMTTLLTKDECLSSPCKNGGTCIDKYNGYICLCEKGWEGPNCADDRDECSLFNGTALACQNGGTCVNNKGSFSCLCPRGFHGIHCANQHDDCQSSSNFELCGHGTCVSIPRESPDEPNFKCICDSGWTKGNSSNAPCDMDINECNTSRSPCSMDPFVACINTLGSFRCGSCPVGYQGNGILCNDINECLENNGGCSKDPVVSCINTIGSYYCGACPIGYSGDGITCTSLFSSSGSRNCFVNNGGCSPLAFCSYSFLQQRAMCTCMSGYTGDGVGPNGCRFSPVTDSCDSSPCKNGGLCSSSFLATTEFICICVPPWAGSTCETYLSTCGGNLTGPSGRFNSPSAASVFSSRLEGSGYAHDSNCTWEITVDPGEVIWLKFLSFQLEQQATCRYDYVQVIDPAALTNTNGSLAKYIDFVPQNNLLTELRYRLCGKEAPPAFTSSSNKLKIVFVSDSSVNFGGFMAVYTAMDATKVCGGELRQSSGKIQSPGFPDDYPAYSSCIWILSTEEGSQVTLNITDFDLELHDDCQADYVEIRNGGSENSPLIGRYCGRQEPMQMKSHSNKLFVKFVSDRFRSARGFRANYYTTATGCNGIMRAPFGHIASPNYPNPYSHNSECYWHIHVAAGSQIQATMVDFDLENSIGCKYDSVSFYDGNSIVSPLIDTFCGTILPQRQIKSTSNEMHIKFRSDLSSHGRGFHLTYQAVCQRQLLKQRTGVIESPGFPELPYPDDTSCDYVIEVPRGNKVNASFSHFNLGGNRNCTEDYLLLHDGDTVGARLLGRFCGNSIPKAIQSSGNQLYVKFVGGSRVGGLGFRLEWVTHGCGGDILIDRRDLPTNFITSPKYPATYPPNTVCEWRLSTTEYGYGIKLDILDIDLEPHGSCRWDKLEIFNGPDSKSPPLTTVCHTQNSTQSLTSSSSQMYIRFQSDQSKSGSGFKARYSMVQSECGGNFSTPTGTIESKLYPGPYDKNLDCGWLITVANQQVVELNITSLNLEVGPSNTCPDEYIAAFDGNNSGEALLFKGCTQDANSTELLRSTSNQIFLQFVTNNITESNKTGFRVWYSTACGAVLSASDSQNELTSPNFPSRYTKNLNCSYVIRSPIPNTKVVFQFTFMDIDDRGSCGSDFIEIRNGENMNSPLVGKYCGRKIPPTIYSSSGSLFLRFVSDDWKEEAGWRAIYTNTLSTCGGELSALEGSFTSPGFPENYPFSTECIWTIKASYGNRVDLNFLTFNLGLADDNNFCNTDYVEVREGGESGTVLGRFCGNEVPMNYTSGMETLWIMFRSSDSSRHPGFFAEYKLRHGGEIVGQTSGKIASPLHPMNYPHNSTFSWRVTTKSDSTIRVTFLRMDMEDRRCYFDYLSLYNGPSFQSPLLGKYCGYELPEPIQTTGNQLFMIMHTDRYGGNGQGFLLEWETVPPAGRAGSTVNTPTSHTIDLLAKRSPQILIAPGYPDALLPNQSYEFRFKADDTSHVDITINDMKLGSSNITFCDVKPKVQIIEGNTYRRLLGIFCGLVSTPKVISSQTGMVRLFLENGAAPFNVNATGFNITYQSVCGANIFSSVGQIQSDDNRQLASGVASVDPNNEAIFCSWNVTSEFGSTFDITFEDFDLERSDNCRDHSLTIKGGFGYDSPVLGQSPYCGTALPPPIKTRTNRFEVRYFKKARASATRGFSLKYQVSRFACGGELKLTDFVRSGLIKSPNYPSNYPTNVECEWVIVAPGGDRIRLDFIDKFEMERPNNNVCPWDYVEVRDGATPDATLLGHFCGQNRPGSLRSKSNVMYVKFRSDRGLVYSGFQANYSIATCGGTIVDQKGTITSPNYPQPYSMSNPFDCEWFVQAPVGHYIDFEMKEFALPQPAVLVYGRGCADTDFVEFRENNETGNVIRTLCGSEVGTRFSSSDSQVYVRFHTSPASVPVTTTENAFKFRIGFSANTEVCGGRLTASRGIITSPGFPNAYPHNRVCTWSIIAPEGRRITLEILEFDIEGHGYCQSDVLELFNGILPDSPRTDRLCGNKAAISTRHSSSMNTMTLKFQTDGSRSNRGFKLSYSSYESATCGGFLTAMSGVLTSPGFSMYNASASYQANEECIWKIRPMNERPSSTITLRFTHLDTETVTPALTQDFCRSDFVEITTTDAPVQTLCGRLEEQPQTTMIIPGSQVTVRFRSDYSHNMRGFRLIYNISECGGIIQSLNGNISTPAYPSPYENNLNCAWLISAPQNMDAQIELTFDAIDVEESPNCTKDFLQILNGRYHTSPKIDTICGTRTPPPIRSQGTSLLVQFQSDNNITKPGFRSTFVAVTDGCGGTLHGNDGIISTPGFQNKSLYPKDVECIWDIIVDSGYHVNLTFTGRFDIQNSVDCEADYVEILDLNRQNVWNRTIKACGIQAPNETLSTMNKLRVKFRSDSEITAKGFSAQWTTGCGGVYLDPEGTIVSPGFPEKPKDNLDCRYEIIAPDDRFYIKLEFDPNNFDLEGVRKLMLKENNRIIGAYYSEIICHDYLIVYEEKADNETDAISPGPRLCGGGMLGSISDVPQPIYARRKMIIDFHTDFALTGNGFKLTYKILDAPFNATEVAKPTPSQLSSVDLLN